MYRTGSKKVLSLVLCATLTFGICSSFSGKQVKAETQAGLPSMTTSGSAVNPDPSPVPTTPVDPANIKINKTKGIYMAGKKVTLSISGTSSLVTWTSKNPGVATVSSTGVVKGVKKGKAVIQASVDGVIRQCTVTIVDKMSKKDFGKFNGENFVSYCQRKGYSNGYAWAGQWKGGGKKKSTYRKIKIDASKTKVQNAYGEISWKKCTSKDPFTKMKGLKKNKVKTYGDVTYGKYRIRFYLNKKNKVVAIILACNIGRIKKKALRGYI